MCDYGDDEFVIKYDNLQVNFKAIKKHLGAME